MGDPREQRARITAVATIPIDSAQHGTGGIDLGLSLLRAFLEDPILPTSPAGWFVRPNQVVFDLTNVMPKRKLRVTARLTRCSSVSTSEGGDFLRWQKESR